MFGMFKKKKFDPTFDLIPEQDEFLASAIEYHNRNNEILNTEWGFDSFEEWGFDQVSGIFFLKFSDGSRVESEGQIYGTFSESESSWEWAWNNPMVDEKSSRDSLQAKEYGEKENIQYLTTGMFPVPDMVFATYLASIAEKLSNAQGVYPGVAGDIKIFLGLKGLRRS